MPKISLRRKKSDNKKPEHRKFKFNLRSRKFLLSLLVILALAGFVYSGVYWYKNIAFDSNRVFYDMIDNSLNTRSVSRSVEQKTDAKTETQNILMSFAPDIKLHSQNYAEQIASDRSKSVVATENYANRQKDFVRYTNIILPTSDNKVDYSKILNTWASKDNKDSNNQSQFLDEAAFTFIPFGNFDAQTRKDMINQLRKNDVYRLEKNTVNYENGRPMYQVFATINPRQFVVFMRDYAKKTGVGNLEQLDPSQYPNNPSFTIKVKIDVISGQLRQIVYPGGDRTEDYFAYGVNTTDKLPKDSITVEALQARLQ